MTEGWIKLYRKSFNHWLYKENRPHTKREAWEDILLLSNHSDEKVLIGNQLIDCKRGQSIMSLNSWAKTFNWTISKVRRFFILLEKDSMIESENVQKSTRITVCNYELYQGDRNDSETILKSKRNDSETQTATNKNDKNDKNDKNYDFIHQNFKDCFLNWLEYKKEKKQSYRSPKSIKQAYENLLELSNNDPVIATEIIKQSIGNNWAGLFKFKKQDTNGNNQRINTGGSRQPSTANEHANDGEL